MPMGTASYFSGSRPRITEAADASETSCSPERPPKRTPTRRRLFSVAMKEVTRDSCPVASLSAAWRRSNRPIQFIWQRVSVLGKSAVGVRNRQCDGVDGMKSETGPRRVLRFANLGQGIALQDVVAFGDFYGVAAHADVGDLVAFFAGAHKDVAGALHLDALQVVDGLIRRHEAVANHPGDGAA